MATATKKTPSAKGREEVQRFINEFGAQGGKWYAEGLTFEQGMTRFTKQLLAERDELRKRLGATERTGLASKIRFAGEQ